MLGDRIFEGDLKIGEHMASFECGTSIIKFPQSKHDYLVYSTLRDQGQEFLNLMNNRSRIKDVEETVPILGLYQVEANKASGRLAVYGDSNCLDSSHAKNSNLKLQSFRSIIILSCFSRLLLVAVCTSGIHNA